MYNITSIYCLIVCAILLISYKIVSRTKVTCSTSSSSIDIKINADKVVVTRPGGEQGKEVIDGYGKPATFYQMQDNGKPVEGHASQMHYELAKDFVVLTGNAYLQQVDSNIKGDKITYLVKEQKMQAFSDKGKRVTTVLVPSQLQDKNNKGQTPAQKKGN